MNIHNVFGYQSQPCPRPTLDEYVQMIDNLGAELADIPEMVANPRVLPTFNENQSLKPEVGQAIVYFYVNISNWIVPEEIETTLRWSNDWCKEEIMKVYASKFDQSTYRIEIKMNTMTRNDLAKYNYLMIKYKHLLIRAFDLVNCEWEQLTLSPRELKVQVNRLKHIEGLKHGIYLEFDPKEEEKLKKIRKSIKIEKFERGQTNIFRVSLSN